MSLVTEILDVQGSDVLTAVRSDDLWVETNDWRRTVEDIVDDTLTRVSIADLHRALSVEPIESTQAVLSAPSA